MPSPETVRLTTVSEIAGKTISEEVTIIGAEAVYGVNAFKDLFAQVRDVFGGRSGSIQGVFKEARTEVLRELQQEAAAVGADAVIGVTLDYEEIQGGGRGGMLMVSATGTAVRLK